MDKLLKLLDTDARLTNAQLAVMLDTTEDDVAAQIAGKGLSVRIKPSSTGTAPTGNM